MLLHLSGPPLKEHYRYVWGFYVRGFKPWWHCQRCFLGTRAEKISPLMEQGIPVELVRPTHFFYLHGYASGPGKLRGVRNIHLAVGPKAGSTATVKSCFGHVFTIEDAEEILIQEPLLRLAHLEDYWSRCKNLRFAAQMYEDTDIGPSVAHNPITALRA